jgi:hypothetical protein
MQFAEEKIADKWSEINIKDALALDFKTNLRCRGCHGRVYAHKDYSEGAKAQFVHEQAHSGCHLTGYIFSGRRSPHPNAIE